MMHLTWEIPAWLHTMTEFRFGLALWRMFPKAWEKK